MERVAICQLNEPDFRQLDTTALSEPEATELSYAVLKTLKGMLARVPIWEQYEFSQRAENCLRRHGISSKERLQDVLRKGPYALPGVGKMVVEEWTKALPVLA